MFMDNSKNWIFGMVLVVAVICLSIVTAGSSYRASAPIKARLSSNIQPAPFCGNGVCEQGETIENCFADCYFLTELNYPEIILEPESSTLINTDFNIIVNLFINVYTPFININKIEIKKQDGYGNYVSTNNCELNGNYNSEFINPGKLFYDTELDCFTNTFTFSCNEAGNYDFIFTIFEYPGSVVNMYGPNGKIITE